MQDIEEKSIDQSCNELLLNYNMGNVVMDDLTLLLNTSKENKKHNLYRSIRKAIQEIKNNKN